MSFEYILKYTHEFSSMLTNSVVSAIFLEIFSWGKVVRRTYLVLGIKTKDMSDYSGIYSGSLAISPYFEHP